jgi:hypothetical protein
MIELERIGEEAIVACFKISQYSPGGTEENDGKESQNSLGPGRNSNWGPLEYVRSVTV